MGDDAILHLDDKAVTQRVVIVRHGQTTWSLTGRHTGRTDLELTDAGVAEARAVAPLVAGLCPVAPEVRSSPLRRARATAALVAPTAAIALDPCLAEWDYGDLEGLTTVEIRARLGSTWELATGPVPGGETLDEVVARADEVVGSVQAAVTVLVSHGHLSRVLASRFLTLPPTKIGHLYLGSAGVVVIDRIGGLWQLTGWNRRAPEPA